MTRTNRALLALGLAAGCSLAVSARASAQMQLAVGQSVQGTLTVSDLTWGDNARYDLYTFYGQAGQTVTITMTSPQFDTYLILQDQNGNQIAYNDDGGGGTNSLIQQALGYTGMYRIIAKAYRADLFGNYVLSLAGTAPVAMGQPQPMPMASPTGVMGQIGANQQVSGNLTTMDARWDGKPIQSWGFQCTAGQAFQMDILSSWDNYAIVFDPFGNAVARDDDGGDVGLNARINHTCTVTGVYRLGITTFSTSTTPGPYTLQVQSLAAAPMAQPQPMPMAPQAAPGVTMPAPAQQAIPVIPGIAAPGEVARIAVGESRQGRLETGDRQMNDGTWADVWNFQGQAGQSVTIELRSEEFDTYLQLLDGTGTRLAEDDDSLGDLDSRIVFTLPATGMYQIVVNNFSDERRAGIYTLSVR